MAGPLGFIGAALAAATKALGSIAKTGLGEVGKVAGSVVPKGKATQAIGKTLEGVAKAHRKQRLRENPEGVDFLEGKYGEVEDEEEDGVPKWMSPSEAAARKAFKKHKISIKPKMNLF